MHETSLLSTPDQFEPVLLPYVSKNDDKRTLLLKII
jgi:hypothetical protein